MITLIVLDAAPQRGHSRLLPRSVRSLGWLAIWIVFAIAGLDLIGWVSGVTVLKSVSPHWTAMRVITALCFLMSAGALACLQREPPTRREVATSRLLGAAVSGVGLLTVASYLVELGTGQGWSWGLSPFGALFLAPATRMAVNTALLFSLFGAALLLLGAGSRRAMQASHVVLLPAAIVSYLVLVGYTLSVRALYEWLPPGVALNTGLAFCALCTAALCARPDTWLLRVFSGDEAGAAMARRLFPGLFVLPLLIGWLRLYGERSGLFTSEVGVALVAVTYTVCFLVLVGLSAGSVNRTGQLRRRAEETLRRQANLLDISYEAIFAWELGGAIISWNRGAQELYGYSREEAVGRVGHELLRTVFPDAVERVLAMVAQDKTWTGELVHTTQGGATITVESRLQLVDDEGGRRIVLETNRDITGRKHAAEMLEEQVRVRTGELAAANEALTREIAERGRTEEELRATSIYARSLLEASLDPLVTISPEGRITDVNEATVEATGVPRTVLIGTDFSDYFTESEQAREGYRRVFAEGFVTDYPLTIRHRNGRLTDVLYNASVYRDLRGNVLGVFAAARDVTAQRQAAQYARSLLEASLDPLVTISPEGRITDVSEATVNVTGVPRNSLIGTDFSDYFTEPEQAREGYRRVFAEGFVTDYPLTIRHRSGRLIDVLYNASVYRDLRGNVLGVFAAARDVTAQRQAAQYARSLLEASLDPLVTISPEGRITDVNEAAVNVTGVPRNSLIGTDFSEYFTEPEQARAGYRHVFSQGFVVDYPLTVRHRDGTLTDVLYNATVYRDVQGNVLGVFAAARDVTERKRAEEEVRRLNEELELRVEQRTAELTAANRELEAFTYSVSHDLRAPLRAMDGFSMALLEDYRDQLDDEAGDYLARIRAASQRMAQLIDDLLQLSRVTRGDMRRAAVDVTALARAAAEELQETQPGRQVSVSIADGLTAEGDPRLLQLVLRNLLANAWKFTSKHLAAHVEVGLAARDGRPAFFVRDDGAGFDMTYVSKLFGVFQRLHGADAFEGTGIGLATVQRIIHRHGGEVWAEGAPEQGATFYFTLPRMSSSQPIAEQGKDRIC